MAVIKTNPFLKKTMSKFKNTIEEKIIKSFFEKHGLAFEYFERINNNLIFVSDYFINISDMKYDLDTEQPNHNFFTWYDLTIEGKTKQTYDKWAKQQC